MPSAAFFLLAVMSEHCALYGCVYRFENKLFLMLRVETRMYKCNIMLFPVTLTVERICQCTLKYNIVRGDTIPRLVFHKLKTE